MRLMIALSLLVLISPVAVIAHPDLPPGCANVACTLEGLLPCYGEPEYGPGGCCPQCDPNATVWHDPRLQLPPTPEPLDAKPDPIDVSIIGTTQIVGENYLAGPDWSEILGVDVLKLQRQAHDLRDRLNELEVWLIETEAKRAGGLWWARGDACYQPGIVVGEVER